MNPLFLIQLSENDKRIIIALCIAIILVFVLIGLLGSLIVKTMKWQSKKCDTLVADVVINQIVTTPHQLRVYARKKNRRYFLKQAWIPLVLVLIGALILVIRNIIFKNWAYNPFNPDDGFATLLFVFDFTDEASYTYIFGVKVLAKWPPLYNGVGPHFVTDAIYSYFAVPLIVIGGVWYLVAAQAYLARTLRAYKLSKTVFEKNLDNFNAGAPIQQPEPNIPNQQ